MNAQPIPDGYRENRAGHMVPESQIKAIDLARDTLVQEKIQCALALRDALRAFKRGVFDDIAAFVQLSAEQYGARIGGDKGNVTLLSFDGRYKVVRAIQDSITFDERLQAAKALIDECLNDWTEGARAELRTLVNNAFRVDQDGNIKTGEVLSLRRTWSDAEAVRRLAAKLGYRPSADVVRLEDLGGGRSRWKIVDVEVGGA
ncbi:DUF3164 family protein [Pseudoxanthomonas winnipegensis]|uniref:DUF3164 family protein n=1 Tax=Pseudoxanthomonas winnipegensis TaxID=2480810 RepID=UPI00102E05BE|nr:DUF3164 family protein [Pseudoxanthomonas winnipegensis]TAA39544.1 DUF3164 family protein [Pseudoxanthomonas winnipegensis]